jgi:hypothetical protein
VKAKGGRSPGPFLHLPTLSLSHAFTLPRYTGLNPSPPTCEQRRCARRAEALLVGAGEAGEELLVVRGPLHEGEEAGHGLDGPEIAKLLVDRGAKASLTIAAARTVTPATGILTVVPNIKE